MAVGRISGPLLKDNLLRNGINLAFETDLLYLDVNNQRVGIKNATPQYELDINGTTRTTTLLADQSATIGQVNIDGNRISSTNGYLYLGTLDDVVYQNKLVVDSIEIQDNNISTFESNANIEFRPHGTGSVDIHSNLNVDGDITVTGTVTADGDIVIGDEDTDSITINADIASNLIPDQTYTYDIGSPTKSWNNAYINDLYFTVAEISDIEIRDNYITTTSSSANLELRANGTGKIYVPSNDVLIENQLTVYGHTYLTDLTASGNVTINGDITQTGQLSLLGKLIVDNVQIDQNTISALTGDLTLSAAGAGSVITDNFIFNGNTISTTGDMILDPSSEIITMNATGALRLPIGSTLDRPADSSGYIRFNTDLARFEGYNGSNWINLKGVEDLDGNTKITAELTEGANDNVIRFYISGVETASIDSTKLTVPQVIVDDINIDGNTISIDTADTDLNFAANGTGSVVFEGAIAFKDNTITNRIPNAVTTFANTSNGYYKFDGTGGMAIPWGTTIQRPPVLNTETGMIRLNTEVQRVEVFDGVSWISVAGSSSGITAADGAEIAIETVLILG
jgi:cytoskeletal protein CcmA (bactofilin family)